jgi:hypothetical protein
MKNLRRKTKSPLQVLLAAAAVASCSPAVARPLWLRCGDDQVNLDMRKEQYETRVGLRLLSGKPEADSKTVVLTTNWSGSSTNDRMVYRLIVDRTTLAYTRQLILRVPSPGGGDAWQIVEQQSGKCNLMAVNYNGKKI